MLVVDRLVNPKILDYARRDAERIFVGKTPGQKSTSQAEINRILVREAAAGKVVARLKGGDPLIFGRAAEEMAALQAAHIDVEVIPGVTAAHACAARIALPVTLREHVRQFSVVTGTTADGEPELDWAALASKGAAFAIYMGVGNAPVIRRNLLTAGRQSRNAGRDRRERHARVGTDRRDHLARSERLRGPARNCRPRRDFCRARLAGRRIAAPRHRHRPSPPGSTRAAPRARTHLCGGFPVSKNATQRSILTANRLGDGTAVFLDFEGAWSEIIAEAVVANSPDEVRALEDRGAYDSAHNLVVEPYLVEVREVAGRIEPIRYRERVRAGGPTILEDVPGYVSPATPLPVVSETRLRHDGERELIVEAA